MDSRVVGSPPMIIIEMTTIGRIIIIMTTVIEKIGIPITLVVHTNASAIQEHELTTNLEFSNTSFPVLSVSQR